MPGNREASAEGKVSRIAWPAFSPFAAFRERGFRGPLPASALAGLRFCAVLGLIFLFTGCGYNRLVRLQQGTDSQWAQVQNVYQRRADLIPNLVKTVEGAANFERSTLREVIEARQQVNNIRIDPNTAPTDPAALQQFQQTQEQLSGALSRLLVTVERYPELKANANFRDLQAQLEGTENRITVERQKFNEATQLYNTAVKSFPELIYAGWLGFKAKPYFQASAGAERPPSVDFNFGTPPSGAASPPPLPPVAPPGVPGPAPAITPAIPPPAGAQP